VWAAGGSSTDIKTNDGDMHSDMHSKPPGKRARIEHDDATAQRDSDSVTHKKTRTSAAPSSSSR